MSLTTMRRQLGLAAGLVGLLLGCGEAKPAASAV
jgi:hypothetical protein